MSLPTTDTVSERSYSEALACHLARDAAAAADLLATEISSRGCCNAEAVAAALTDARAQLDNAAALAWCEPVTT